MINYLSLFSGIGGCKVASERYNWRCVGFVEKDRNLINFLSSTYPDIPVYKDVLDYETWLPKINRRVDVIVMGFPCQTFSAAGKQLGVEPVDNLFTAVSIILNHLQPRFFVLENVCNFVRFKGLARLEQDLDYSIISKEINTNVWLPQNRNRIYVIGSKITLDRDNFWLDRKSDRGNKKTLAEAIKLQTLGIDRAIGFTKCDYGQDARLNEIPTIRRAARPAIAYNKNGSLIMRGLTPQEAEILQGYPVDYTASLPSTTARFNALGNAFSVPAIDYVFFCLSKQYTRFSSPRLTYMEKLSAMPISAK